MQRGERRVDGVLDSDLLYHRNQFCLNKLIMKEKKKDILLKLNPLNRARACIGCGTRYAMPKRLWSDATWNHVHRAIGSRTCFPNGFSCLRHRCFLCVFMWPE